MKIVGIIQARMSSTRLPGKVLLDLAGQSVLAHVVNRCQRAVQLDEIVVATTTSPVDRPIVQLCIRQAWPCFCGSERDVLDRYYQAALMHEADIVVRITADCPLIDPEVIDRVISEYLENQPLDYASNRLSPRISPTGQEIDVLAFDALKRAWFEDTNPDWREHVTPYIYCHPEKFAIRTVLMPDIDQSPLRCVVDTSEDLDFMQRIYGHFAHDKFSWADVVALLEQHSEWLEINRYVVHKGVRRVEA